MLLRETFPAGAFECNCTVLACGDTKDAIIIDPGGEVEHIAELVAHYDLTVRAIVHTHAHLDHIYCTRDIKQAHGGEVCLHPGDRFLYDGLAMQARMFGWAPREGTPVERWLADGDHIAFGKRSALVLHTPGHTPGSVCFEVVMPGAQPLVFAGDTLFRRGVGRTDLPGGDKQALAASIKERLYTAIPTAWSFQVMGLPPRSATKRAPIPGCARNIGGCPLFAGCRSSRWGRASTPTIRRASRSWGSGARCRPRSPDRSRSSSAS